MSGPCIYSDGSGYQGGIGAAAVLMLPDGRSEELMVYLGPNTEHIVVYDGELAGAILATELADHFPHGT